MVSSIRGQWYANFKRKNGIKWEQNSLAAITNNDSSVFMDHDALYIVGYVIAKKGL